MNPSEIEHSPLATHHLFRSHAAVFSLLTIKVHEKHSRSGPFALVLMAGRSCEVSRSFSLRRALTVQRGGLTDFDWFDTFLLIHDSSVLAPAARPE